jgi:hypothetical protein
MDHVFAYGSLAARGGVPAQLEGWTREWGVAMDNAVDLPAYKHYLLPDGTRPALCVAFLDIAPCDGASVAGVCVPVDPAELGALDLRERNYERIDVSGAVRGGPGGRVWTYTGRADSRARLAEALAEGRAAIARSYLEAVRSAFVDGVDTGTIPVLALVRHDTI